MSCDSKYSVALLHGAVGWSAVCVFGISSSYSFAFLNQRKEEINRRKYFMINFHNEWDWLY